MQMLYQMALHQPSRRSTITSFFVIPKLAVHLQALSVTVLLSWLGQKGFFFRLARSLHHSFLSLSFFNL